MLNGLMLLMLAQGATTTLSPEQSQEKLTLLHFCEKLEQSVPHTIDGIRDRTDCWKRMELEGMGDSTISRRYQAAVHDYDEAVKSDSVRRATDLGEAAIEQHLTDIPAAITAHAYDRADSTVRAVLAVQPENQRALAYRDRIVGLRSSWRLRQLIFRVGGAVLALALLFAITAKVLSSRRSSRLERERTVASQRQAMVEIVDGIGRGKLYTLTGTVFRIGSAESDRPEEKNDLILSDATTHISRYHCSIIRKDGQYYLIDSSLNGTYIDDELVDRGNPILLGDGTEFSLAGMSRLKFLLV